MTDRPQQSYLIWFSQRVGSTVLTQTLEDIGIAGRPREWLNDDSGGLLAKFGATNAGAVPDSVEIEVAVQVTSRGFSRLQRQGAADGEGCQEGRREGSTDAAPVGRGGAARAA